MNDGGGVSASFVVLLRQWSASRLRLLLNGAAAAEEPTVNSLTLQHHVFVELPVTQCLTSNAIDYRSWAPLPK